MGISIHIYYTPEKLRVNEKFEILFAEIYIPAIKYFLRCEKIPESFRELGSERGKTGGKPYFSPTLGLTGDIKNDMRGNGNKL